MSKFIFLVILISGASIAGYLFALWMLSQAIGGFVR